LIEQLNSGLCLQALSSRSIFVKKLRAAESLAYVDIIVTDKTGTLTHNKLRLKSVWTPSATQSGDADVTMTTDGTRMDGEWQESSAELTILLRLPFDTLSGRFVLCRLLPKTDTECGRW
jgi:magnesium-transporting ATPase (P-type)